MAQISKIKLPNNIAYDITDVSAVHSTDKGVANGVAPLNASRLIDSTYLPSYVDDVIEGYYYNNKFWKESAHTTEISGEAGKIYIDLTVNPASTYRYTGSSFVKIGGSGSVITITRNLTSGTKSATINIDGTDYDLYSTDNTTYGAGTGLSLTNNSFSVKLGYTTSGNNRAVQADGNGNLYVVQKDDNNTYSAGSGLSLSGSTFNHSNSVTAQTTQAVYPIKIDAQGHISGYGSAVTIPDVSGKIDTAGTGLSKFGTTLNHSNSITAQTTQAVYPIKIDAQGHISAYGSAVTIVNTRGTATSGGTTLSLVNTGDMYTWNNKQAALVSGTNIKTINGTSLLGSGDIEIESGGGVLSMNIDSTDVHQLNIVFDNDYTDAESQSF